MTKEEAIELALFRYGAGIAQDVSSLIRQGKEPEEALSDMDILQY